MKKLLLLSVFLYAGLLQLFATDYTDSNGVTWTFEKRIYSYSSAGTTLYYNYYTITAVKNYGENVVVPEKLYIGETLYPVEAIGDNVFQDSRTLTSVELPTTIKCIGSYAFQGCPSLTTVTGIENCEYILNSAFQDCSNLRKIDLSSCQHLYSSVFLGCSNLEDIVSLVACKIIDNHTFYNCQSLKSIDLRENVTIGEFAFYYCTSLANVGSLKGAKIGSHAFSGCSNLSSVDLSETVSVGSRAFYNCEGLTSIGDLSTHTAIADYVFSNCYNLEEVNLSNCRSIGQYAFSGCSSLQSVDLGNVASIGESAFSGCSQLESVGDISKFTTIPNSLFSGCKIQSVDLPNATSIGGGAFSDCSALASISLPNATSIGGTAFNGCSALTSISLPVVEKIGWGAFWYCPLLTDVSITSTNLTSISLNAFSRTCKLTLFATTPPKLIEGNYITSGLDPGFPMMFRVPDEAVEAYHNAEVWSDIKSRIVGIGTKIDYDVEVAAQNNHSGLIDAIGENNLGHVVNLKVTGDINSYDIMVMRNKMDNLHYLDLSDANIVANNYEYYTGYHSEDNVLGPNSFRDLTKLQSVRLPKTITEVGNYAFYGCNYLNDVEFQTGINRLGNYAFQGCNLTRLELKKGLVEIGNYAFGSYTSSNMYHRFEEIIFPEGLISIGSYAFGSIGTLKRVMFPPTLKSISSYAFYGCGSLENVSLPTSLENIQSYTFSKCYNLTEVRIPSSIQSIGNYAFEDCNNLNDVYTYIVEPTSINMNTFSTYESATLHVPSTSYYNYWYNTEWSQFRTLSEFDADYQYFYINNDFTISDEAGTIHGDEENDPSADLNPGSGLIVETENDTQKLEELHIKMKDSQSASVIAASNIAANKVYFDISIEKGRWYFLCFPFNVKTVNVEAPGNYVFRIYDPEERANGKTGWVNWIGDILYAGQGYIFHCSKAGVLSLCVEKEDMNWNADNRPQTLTASSSSSEQDASWNFIGNPHTSYYDINQTNYTQPITIWNGTSYEAIRPGDDDYCLKPFEGFFVQKPDEVSEMEFPAKGTEDGRYTYLQMLRKINENAANAKGVGKVVSSERQIVNLTISDGQIMDKTRVVFNEKQSQDYEMSCDAAKFLTTEQVPQIYSQDNSQTKYAINERPTGEVSIGYVAAKQGELTISVKRMDQPVLLYDKVMQITHDLLSSDYNFSTSAGTFNDRFTLIVNPEATSVGKMLQQTGVSVYADKGGFCFSGIEKQNVSVYSVGGTLLATNVQDGFLSLPSAVYIVKVDNNSTKVLIR